VYLERAEAPEKDANGKLPPSDADTEWLSDHYELWGLPIFQSGETLKLQLFDCGASFLIPKSGSGSYSP
jgi:hypothetical protein